MSRQQTATHYARLLRLWPKDRIRPEERHFQRLLQTRIQNTPTGVGRNETREINAAYLLLDNSLTKNLPLSDKTLKPASDPEHYEKLAKELDEAPDRGMMGRLWKRISGMVRFR